MKTMVLIGALLLSVLLHAQTGLQRVYSTGIQNSFSGLAPYSGGYALCGISNFNYDSSWLHLVLLDADGNVSTLKTWRGELQLTFMQNAIALNNGFLLCGNGSATFGFFHPYMIRTDLSGNVQWSKWFDNLDFGSHQLKAIVPNGNDFTVYSYPDAASAGFYRIEGDETGNSFSAVSVTYANPFASMRLYKAAPFSTGSDHLLAGVGFYSLTATGADGLLIKMDPASVTWSKLFHFGSTLFEDFEEAIITTGDSVIAVAYGQDDTTSLITSFVVKMSPDGVVKWCKQLTLGSLLEIFRVVETSSGDIIVAGLNATYDGILIKLSGQGNLIWAKLWTPSIVPLTYFANLNHDATKNEIIVSGIHDGSFMVLHLDENGDGCEFQDITGLQVNDFSPEVNDLPLLATSFVPSVQTEALSDRTSTITTQDICVTGIEPVVVNGHPVASPNPSAEVITISLPLSFANATLNLFDLTGRKVYAATAKNPKTEIAVGNLQKGIYLLEIVSGDKLWSEKVVVE